MARKIEIERTDDIDGTAATETVDFGLDGNTYEIDLNEVNARKLRAAIYPWMERGRRKPGRVPTPKRRPGGEITTDGHRLQTIREWAVNNGYEVSPRGRVAASIMDAYREANAARPAKAKVQQALSKAKAKLDNTPEFSG